MPRAAGDRSNGSLPKAIKGPGEPYDPSPFESLQLPAATNGQWTPRSPRSEGCEVISEDLAPGRGERGLRQNGHASGGHAGHARKGMSLVRVHEVCCGRRMLRKYRLGPLNSVTGSRLPGGAPTAHAWLCCSDHCRDVIAAVMMRKAAFVHLHAITRRHTSLSDSAPCIGPRALSRFASVSE